MADNGVIEPVPSFLMESAVYNVPDPHFDSPQNYSNVLACLKEFVRVCSDKDLYREWKEVNELKYLFRGGQSWTIDDLSRLLDAAVDYLKAG
jgi:hypothetical protein